MRSMSRSTTLYRAFYMSFCLISMFCFGTAVLNAAPPVIAPSATPMVKKPTKPLTTPATVDTRIDINTATVSDLMKLKGIGKKRAEAIIKDRETNGPFNSAMDLTRIRGIGKKIVENNTEQIKTGAPSTPSDAKIKPTPNPKVRK